MKKFFSIALALVLLIGALPFQAAAAGTYDASVDVDGVLKKVVNVSSMSYADCMSLGGVDTENVNVTKVVYEGEAVSGTMTLVEGQTIELAGVTRFFVFTEPKATEAPAPTEAPQKPVEDNKLTDYTKFAYPVYLNIYTDTTVGTVKKTVNITEGIANDGLVTLDEVKTVVEHYYNSVNTDKGIQYDGLYPAQGNWVEDYVADQKYERIGGLYAAAAENYVYINVMITNATTAAAGTASTNPKTGDAIFAPVAIMAVSASALALFFFYNKKRAAI